MHNRILIIVAIIAIGFSTWGVYNAYTESKELKFSKDADIYDMVDKGEIATIDSLADRGFVVRYEVRYIAVHCTGSQSNRPMTRAELDRVFKERGWGNKWGYHYVINPTQETGVLSSVTNLQPNYITPSQIRYGVKNYNSTTVNVAWVGGYDGKDGRTDFQKSKLIELITMLKKLYPKATVKSHYQFPGVNKTCANFDAYEEYKNIK